MHVRGSKEISGYNPCYSKKEISGYNHCHAFDVVVAKNNLICVATRSYGSKEKRDRYVRVWIFVT